MVLVKILQGLLGFKFYRYFIYMISHFSEAMYVLADSWCPGFLYPDHYDGFVQGRRYSIANVLELCLSCNNLSIIYISPNIICTTWCRQIIAADLRWWSPCTGWGESNRGSAPHFRQKITIDSILSKSVHSRDPNGLGQFCVMLLGLIIVHWEIRFQIWISNFHTHIKDRYWFTSGLALKRWHAVF